MKPFSERIKSFHTEQCIDWRCLACVDVRQVRTEEDAQDEINNIHDAVTERLSALEARVKALSVENLALREALDAAEAELARLKAQEPVAYTDAEELETLRKGTFADMFTPCDQYKNDPQWIPLYAEPRPAVLPEMTYQGAKGLFNYLMTEEELNATVSGYNQAIADAKALSCQPQVAPDYFAGLVASAVEAAQKAMVKFPQPNYVLLKVAEEAGEVVQAGVHYAEGRETWAALEGEVVQTIAMLYRLVTEGDHINGVFPPEANRGEIAE